MKSRTPVFALSLAGASLCALALLSPGSAREEEPVTTMPVFASLPQGTQPLASSAFAQDCRDLTATSLAGGEVLSADPIRDTPAAAFLGRNGGQALPPHAETPLPPFCRVRVRMAPVSGSQIHVEVWLPSPETWNARFLGTGNGGPGGAISYFGMAAGLHRGFAVANSDLGTSPVSDKATIFPATARPESAVDLGHRADHQMTRAAKTLIGTLYGKAPKTSLFEGCSTGGQEALALAQRYPADYDGILAGAPANNRTHLHAYFLWNFHVQQAIRGGLTQTKLAMVHDKVLESCAGRDGGLAGDDFLTDPRQCDFDITTLPICPQGSDADTCLTHAQFDALGQLYQGPINPRTGERIFAGVPFGVDWSGVLAHGQPFWQNIDTYTWNWTFGNGYDYRTFDFDRDLDAVDANSASYLNSNSADLSEFRNRGGKLVLYTGSADPHIPYPDTLHYYERLVAANGSDLAATQGFARYYVAPGMGHCEGGAGFGHFGQGSRVPTQRRNDILLQLLDWVETNKAPSPVAQQLAKTGSQITAERPLCAYPAYPAYTGGERSSATSYQCTVRQRGTVPTPAPRYLNAP
ncbi:tannase/feruloyl esterase family alpha/beta hydrolase [Novosphingobium profundi]|uniref:tannase/feruloyl esterase family alpha/beta hydrolase n=1 Tax=Novosphingobium profundi TaxID=1774954 RepID=UPI001CFD4AA0|nr:tannase/feruloyl esterase family alpha/beta hydrolase [Novosphingobium profundi]